MPNASVLTYGCAHNQKDSQLIEAQLLKHGYQLVNEQEADLVVVNTCTVKAPTENRIITKLDELQNRDQVIVTGCLSQANPEIIRKRYPNYVVMGINAAPFILQHLKQVKAINQAAESTLIELPLATNGSVSKNNKVLYAPIEETFIDKPALPSTRWNPHLNIIQINEGCLNTCSFCATKLARGRLQSYSPESIIRSIRQTPTSEVWLTSQDTGCYGFDMDTSLPSLLQEVDKIDRKFWLRVGMGNPNNLIKVLDDTIAAYHSEKVFKFLHLPVQSGSNDVLKHMKRGYTVEEYEYIVKRFKEDFPDLMLATDIIVGYPTETEADFEATIKTLQNTSPQINHISRYWTRRDTPAAKLEQLPQEVRKERGKIVTEITEAFQLKQNQRWRGWQGEALVVDQGATGGVEARNLYYRPIILEKGTPGQWYNVEITEVEATYFKGEIIET